MAFELSLSLKGKKGLITEGFFYLLVGIFFASLIFTLILNFEIKRERKILSSLEEKILKFGTEEEKEMEKKVISYKKKIFLSAKLLRAHRYPTKFFKFLEEKSLATLYLLSLDLSLANGWLKLNGLFPNYFELAKQLKVFEETKEFEKISSFSSGLEKEGIIFSMGLRINPDIFLWQ